MSAPAWGLQPLQEWLGLARPTRARRPAGCMGPHCGDRHNSAPRSRGWWKWTQRVQLQRGWCCSPECFEAACRALATDIIGTTPEPRRARPHRIPLGLQLLSRGVIRHDQLCAALDEQQARGGRIGMWLVRQGATSEEEIAAGVALQWARPTFPLAQSQGWRQCVGWAPLPMIESLRMLPLHFAPAQKRLYVGFTQVVDAEALAVLGQMFDCTAEACIVTDTAFDAAVDAMRALPELEAIQHVSFDSLREPREIAGVVRQYARYADARQVKIANAGAYVWVRIRGARAVHLTFRYR